MSGVQTQNVFDLLEDGDASAEELSKKLAKQVAVKPAAAAPAGESRQAGGVEHGVATPFPPLERGSEGVDGGAGACRPYPPLSPCGPDGVFFSFRLRSAGCYGWPRLPAGRGGAPPHSCPLPARVDGSPWCTHWRGRPVRWRALARPPFLPAEKGLQTQQPHWGGGSGAVPSLSPPPSSLLFQYLCIKMSQKKVRV